jgi:hypothetical protein
MFGHLKKEADGTFDFKRSNIVVKIAGPNTFLGLFANCENRLLASPCLSVRMEQLRSHWTDFHEI